MALRPTHEKARPSWWRTAGPSRDQCDVGARAQTIGASRRRSLFREPALAVHEDPGGGGGGNWTRVRW